MHKDQTNRNAAEPRKESDAFIRNEKDFRLAAMADKLAGAFAERADIHDREGSFPFENFTDMHTEGFLALPLPIEYGGSDLSLYELVIVQERLARGDGSTALAVGWHMGMTLNLRTTRAWPEPLFESFCKDVINKGAMINSFASEPATGSPSRGGMPQTKAEPVEGGWILTGRKTFSTLSPILDRFLATAALPDGSMGEFLVRVGPGVRVEETWDTIGMRGTGSNDVILEEAFVPEHALMETMQPRGSTKRNSDGSGWMLHIPACYMGIAYAARDYALRTALSYRPSSLNGQSIADLPHIQDKIAQMEVDLRTSRALLYRTAAQWDANPDKRLSMKTDLGLAKYVATNAAIRIVDLAMRIVGGSALSRSLPLERMYRDVRAGLHNPPMDDTVMRNLAQSAISEFL